MFIFTVFFHFFYDFQKDRLEAIKYEYANKIENSYYKNKQSHLKEYSYEVARTFLNSDIIQAVEQEDKKKHLKNSP